MRGITDLYYVSNKTGYAVPLINETAATGSAGSIKNEDDDVKNKLDREQRKGDIIKDYGQITLSNNKFHYNIHLLNIIGEIEGHDCLGAGAKTSKYEHILPQLALVEDDMMIDGVLVMLNTLGGDVEAGLAIAEMIASLSKPVVTLVLGGGHSIGVPLAVSGDCSFIVPSATMVVHPIRMNGTVLGVKQNYEYIERMQDRIIEFTATHASVTEENLRKIMFNTKELTKDIGSVLIGKEAVDKGIIDRVGGINSALNYLYNLINNRKNSKMNSYEYSED